MRSKVITTALGAAILLVAIATPGGAAPTGSHSPNLEGEFPVVCNGVPYTLIDAPSSEKADFSPAFITGTHKVVIPYAFDTTQTVTALTDGSVFDGVTYNAGDVIFTGSETQSIGTARHGGRTCTFGGDDVETVADDNGTPVQVRFLFEGTAQAVFPNSR